MKALLFVVFLLSGHWAGLACAQNFVGLRSNSPQPQLAAPLQWKAVPKAADNPSAAPALLSPEAVPGLINNNSAAALSTAFQDVTPRTVLPTSPTQNVWMRFTLAPTAATDSWYLRIPRVNPVRVTLFSLDAQGVWQAQAAGNLVAPAQWPLRTRTPTFELKTSTTAPKTYLLSYENFSVMAERPQLLSASEYMLGVFSVGSLIGVLTALFSLLFVLSIAAYVLAKNTVFLWLAAFVAAMLMNQLTLLGFAGWMFWPGSQHLNQNMPWAVSFMTLASGAALMAKASYAQDTHPWIYRMLFSLAVVSLLLGVATGFELDTLPRGLRNLWAGFVVVLSVAALMWMTLRGNRFNGWLLLGLVPMSLAGLYRVIHNLGGLTHVEFAQLPGLVGTAVGLSVLLSALAWRSRATLLSSRRDQAFADYDAETGLLLAEGAKSLLPRMLLRGNHLKSGSGVLLLRWLDEQKFAGLASIIQRRQILRKIGDLMRDAGRDIDSLIRHEDHDFLMLVEGPISRDALAAIASQIMAASLRGIPPPQTGGAVLPVNLHIAIWQETEVSTSANNVMALLYRRLNMMTATTQRRVQFIDSTAVDVAAESKYERDRRKQEVLDKIREIEGEPTQMDTLR